MNKFKGWEEQLEYYDELFLAKEDDFEQIYSDKELLFEFMEATKNKKVFIMCMELLPIPFILEKIKDPKTSQEMIFKLTLHPNSFIQSAILSREDVTPAILKQLIDNFKYKEDVANRWVIIQHKKMNEKTLYELTDYDNYDILSEVLLSDKTSQRIIEKLEHSTNLEIQTIAKLRNPKTDIKYIEEVIKDEIKKANIVVGDCINGEKTKEESLGINDKLEAAIRNPKLPTRLVEMYKNFTKLVVLNLVIPHQHISKELLDYYYENGDEDIKNAVLERIKNSEKQSR